MAEEDKTHSFIVKIWLENTVEEAGQASWRGHITHVPSGQRRYLQSLAEIIQFMVPYLEEMGVNPAPEQNLQQWLQSNFVLEPEV